MLFFVLVCGNRACACVVVVYECVSVCVGGMHVCNRCMYVCVCVRDVCVSTLGVCVCVRCVARFWVRR